MAKAYIGLGANLGDPAANLDAALRCLAVKPQISMLRCSGYWRSRAIGPQPQPDYCNAVCAIETSLTPEELLCELLAVEDAAGRTRKQRWGPRVLDLDLLHVEGVRRTSASLVLPHPQLKYRAFVLLPLAEVAPGLFIDNLGTVADLAKGSLKDHLQPWKRSF